MSMLIKPNDINSITVESGSYEPYTDLVLVESDDDAIKFYVKNIVITNTSDSNVTATIKLNNNIIISKTVTQGEYFNYTPEIIVTKTTPLSISIGPQPSCDISILYIEKIDIVEE